MIKMLTKESMQFLAKFFAIFIVVQILLFVIDISPIQKTIAQIEYNFLPQDQIALNGIDIIKISGEQSIFSITQNCTGLLSIGILAALIFSFSKPDLKSKLLIFLAGAIILFTINLFRVYIVILAGIEYGIETANLLHTVSWLGMSIIILVIWLKLLERIAKVSSVKELV